MNGLGTSHQRLIKWVTLLSIVLWSVILCGSLVWNISNAEKQTMDRAYAEARANLNKDFTFRRWVTEQGGVYVPITEKQPSVPWLAHVPGRDVTTSDGKRLTLLNPASVLRQIMDSYAEEYGIRGRITGLKYLNPGNAPDAWEKEQLEAFTRGEKTEVWAEANLGGQPHLRYLRAMPMVDGCEKCHAILGYKLGDMRGATGINLPLAPYQAEIASARLNLALSHGLIWLLGLLGIGYSSTAMLRSRQQMIQLNSQLEARVEQRTADMKTARDEAERANTAKSEFLSRMSHELRTPLNAILGFGQLLESDTEHPLTTTQKDDLQEILNGGEHLLELINEVLDLARIESGRLELELEPIPAIPLIDACIRHVQPEAGKRGIRIFHHPCVPFIVQADATRFKEVLFNLLSNAVKYNREGGSIEVRCSANGERMRISVQDSGYGIPAESLPRLFRPFERLESAYSGIDGTGIGLALAKKLVEAMHGEIGMNSVPGEGSTFWFELPANTATQASGKAD